jgi:uncharacterized protein YraI
MKAVCLVLSSCVLVFAPLAQAQRAGVIDDPDGFVNVRAGKSSDAAVIATVKTGEPFTFECENDADWCKVALRSPARSAKAKPSGRPIRSASPASRAT